MKQSGWAALLLAVTLAFQAGCASTGMMGSPEDQRIASEVRTKLRSYPSLHIDVRNGVVYVVGAVGTAAQRSQIQEAVREVPGVTGVAANIGVGPYEATQ
jgi:osmotically-inducible protein OsmY